MKSSKHKIFNDSQFEHNISSKSSPERYFENLVMNRYICVINHARTNLHPNVHFHELY